MAVATRAFGLNEWRECIKAAGQYIIDHTDEIIKEGEQTRAVNIAIKGIEHGCIPTLEIGKEYNILEMVDKTII